MLNNSYQYIVNYYHAELDSITEYIKHSDQSILTAQNDFFKRHESSVDGLKSIVISGNVKKEYDNISDVFPNFFRFSTFMGLYSLFENELIFFCKEFKRKNRLTIDVSDLAGSNLIERTRKYIQIVGQVNLKTLDKDWNEITKYQKIRNCFVHNGSNILTETNKDLKQQKLYATVISFSSLMLTDFGIVFITNNSFVFDFIELQKRYLSSFITLVQTKYQSE